MFPFLEVLLHNGLLSGTTFWQTPYGNRYVMSRPATESNTVFKVHPICMQMYVSVVYLTVGEFERPDFLQDHFFFFQGWRAENEHQAFDLFKRQNEPDQSGNVELSDTFGRLRFVR